MKGICNQKNTSILLASLGAAGTITTAILAAKATPKAVLLVHEDSRAKHGDPNAFTKKEAIKSCWKCYIPTVLVGASTIACIFGSTVASKQNQASLASAYGLLNESYNRYREAAKEVYGEDANEKICARVAKDADISAYGYYIYSKDLDKNEDEILCYDMIGQRYFKSTLAAVLNAEYHLNRNLSLRGDASVNEFFEFLGIDGIENGDVIGWNMSELMDGGICWLDFENTKAHPADGMECCVVSVAFNPTWGYLDYEG